MENELTVLEETNHPNTVRIFELLHDHKYYYIVAELVCEGELYEFLVERQKKP